MLVVEVLDYDTTGQPRMLSSLFNHSAGVSDVDQHLLKQSASHTKGKKPKRRLTMNLPFSKRLTIVSTFYCFQLSPKRVLSGY